MTGRIAASFSQEVIAQYILMAGESLYGDQIPSDAKFLHCYIDQESYRLVFVFEHPSIPDLPDGAHMRVIEYRLAEAVG